MGFTIAREDVIAEPISNKQLLVLGALAAAILVWLYREARLLRAAHRAVPIRVHVNGTRGKSSVTRLIAAGLRAGGIRTSAKTTGTLPRFILPDGREDPILRPSRANISEQVSILRRAAEENSEALVIECMALQPFLQWVSTARIVQPTIGVITNIREDHLDVMGPDLEGVAKALLGSVPEGGRLLTAETRFSGLLATVLADRNATARVIRPETAETPVTERELRRFRYIEHAENVQLALAVCEELGVTRRAALVGMQRTRPDPGALTIEYIRFEGQELVFVNGFAANDPESTGQVWELALARTDRGVRRIALVNCRADRADRSAQIGHAVASWTAADAYVVVGTGTHFFLQRAREAGVDPKKLVASASHTATELARELKAIAGPSGVVVGMGNIGGIGLELIAKLREEPKRSWSSFQSRSVSASS